ncbi:MAG: glycosyltransferase family 2 protein [Bacteroidota bacterium]
MSAFCFYQILFWIPVGLLFYSYILYPIILEIIFLLKGKSKINEPPTTNYEPTISILLSVFNEEKVIEEKIKNIFESDYPTDKLEIIIGNDCSSDSTREIITRQETRNPKLITRNFDVRRGKPAVLNDLVKAANGEIILLTDANIFFEKDAIKKLVAHFNDAKIGLVGGNIINKASGKGISNQEKTYINRENRIKFLEGKNLGSMIGPFGGFYALRKNLYQTVPENFLVDDFFICMNVLEQNFKSIAEPEAIAYEEVSEDWKQEYKRKARISAGNFQNLLHFESLLLQFNGTAFCFFSHKVLRWFGPFFILIAFLISIPLAFAEQSGFYDYILMVQIVLFISPFIQRLLEAIQWQNPIWKTISYFYTMNFALLNGWFRFIKGIKSGAWTPTKR